MEHMQPTPGQPNRPEHLCDIASKTLSTQQPSTPLPEQTEPSKRMPVEVTLSGHRNFIAKLTVQFPYSSPGFGQGTFSVTSTTADGTPVATYSCEPGSIGPSTINTLGRLLKETRNPQEILSSCLKVLNDKESIQLRLQVPMRPQVSSQLVPGAFLKPLPLEEVANSPERADLSLYAVSKLSAESEECGSAPSPSAEVAQYTMQVDIFSGEGVLTATFLAPRLDGTCELEPLRRFRIESQQPLDSKTSSLRKDLLKTARGLFDIFLKEGLEEAVSTLERKLLPAHELPATQGETQAEGDWISSGVPTAKNLREKMVASTGTQVTLTVSESVAAIGLAPAEWAEGFQPRAVIIFEARESGKRLGAGSLRYVREVFRCLSSDDPHERRSGLEMIRAIGEARVLALEPIPVNVAAALTPPPLIKAMRHLTIRTHSAKPLPQFLAPWNLIKEAWELGVSVDVPGAGEAANLLNLVEGRISRRYLLQTDRHGEDRSHYDNLCVTERFDGAIWAHATSSFGGALQGRLLELEGASLEDRVTAEIGLLRAMAQQKDESPSRFQSRFIQAMSPGPDQAEDATNPEYGSTEEQGLWDGTLTNVPPTTDSEAWDALRSANSICARLRDQLEEAGPPSCSYLGEGRMQVFFHLTNPLGGIAITLHGDRLVEVAVGYSSTRSQDPGITRFTPVASFAAATPAALGGEDLYRLQAYLQHLIDNSPRGASQGELGAWIKGAFNRPQFLIRDLGFAELPTASRTRPSEYFRPGSSGTG